MSRPILFAAASGLWLALPAIAAADPPATAANTAQVTVAHYRIDPVFVVRTPSERVDTVSATVITSDDIILRQASSPREVINTVPGLAVERSGAFGGLLSVRQRGASSDKTLILLDGVPLNDPSQPSGGTDLNLIDMADVTRVEILSGPQGSLWGSDAIGGVISFITRPPQGWRVELEGGPYGYARGSASAGAQTERFDGGLSAAGWRADGISAADARDGNTEADGGRSYTIAGRARLRLSEAVAVFGQVRYLDSHSDTDGFPPPNFTLADTAEFATNRTWFGQAGVDADAFGASHRLTYAAYDIDRANLGGDFPSSFTARRQVARYTATRGSPTDPFSLQGGLEYEDNRASLSDGTHLAISNASAFLVARINPTDAVSLTGSVRYDDPSDFTGVATGRLAAIWRLGGGFSLTGAWGQGFKTPTISQLACDFCFPGGVSTGLRPERANGYEGGVRWQGDRVEAQVTAYELKVRNQIEFSANFPFRYGNLAEARSRGVEASAQVEITDAWRLSAGYAYTDAIDVGSGDQLLRVPRHSGSLSLAYHGQRFSGELVIRAESDQADSGGERRPGFTVANLNGQYALTDHIELTARIENLTDTHYQEVLGYGETGFAVYGGVRLRG